MSTTEFTFFLRVDLMTKLLTRHDPFCQGLDLIEINSMTKFHEECIKTAPSEVYTCFFSKI